MNERGPMYGLPIEHRGQLSGWDELLEHLNHIARSDVAVRVAVTRDPAEQRPYFEAYGKLYAFGRRDTRDVYVLNTMESREEGGWLSLPRDDYLGGSLLTYDGDDYFSLVIRLKGAVLQLQDTNSI